MTAVLFTIILMGSMIQGATGFGFAIFTMSILPLFLPFKTASAVVLILAFILAAQLFWRLRKHVNVKLVVPALLASFAGRIAGVHVLMSFKDDVLKVVLGVVLILLSAYFFFYNGKVHIKPSIRNGITAGLMSGLLGGMFNIGGPPLVIYFFQLLLTRWSIAAAFKPPLCSVLCLP